MKNEFYKAWVDCLLVVEEMFYKKDSAAIRHFAKIICPAMVVIATCLRTKEELKEHINQIYKNNEFACLILQKIIERELPEYYEIVMMRDEWTDNKQMIQYDRFRDPYPYSPDGLYENTPTNYIGYNSVDVWDVA